MNKIKDIASLLGLRLFEEFEINKVPYGPCADYTKTIHFGRHRFAYGGLEKYDSENDKWVDPDANVFNHLLTRLYEIRKHILTIEEKKYLDNMIAPFEYYVKTLEKKSCKVNDHDYEYIRITVSDMFDKTKQLWYDSYLFTPDGDFEFMELDKKYEKYQLELEFPKK